MTPTITMDATKMAASCVATPMSMHDSNQPDVVVIGGGPGGSTIAALLATKGHSVVLLEKAHHPRFHIGESLLPMNMPLFDRLGVRNQIEAVGIQKFGAQFVSPWHERTTLFAFADAWDKSFPYAVQVRRSVLDEILFRHAAMRGARTMEGRRVMKVDFEVGERPLVSVRADDGTMSEYRPRFVVDASGRDTLLSNQLGIKRRNKKNNSAALYGHFESARRDAGMAEGNIILFWFDHGWFWFIPLADGATSVGAVCTPDYLKTRTAQANPRTPTEFLLDTIALCPPLAERLKDARLIEDATATGNYSYESTRCHGDRYIAVGDAYAFIDPVFSSGVYLAMNSAFQGVDVVDAWIRNDRRAAAKALRAYDRAVVHGTRVFSWFIYRTPSPAFRNLFMSPRNIFRAQEAVLSVLAGDIFRNTPIGPSLFAFKIFYYGSWLADLRKSFAAWKKCKKMRRQANADAAHASH